MIFPESTLYRLRIYASEASAPEEKEWVVEYPIYVKILNKASKGLSFPESNFENIQYLKFEPLTHYYNIVHEPGLVVSPKIL